MHQFMAFLAQSGQICYRIASKFGSRNDVMEMLDFSITTKQTSSLLLFTNRCMKSISSIQSTVRKVDILLTNTRGIQLHECKSVQLYYYIGNKKNLLDLFQKIQMSPKQLCCAWCQPSLRTQTIVKPCFCIDYILNS